MSEESDIHDYEPKPSVRATGSVKREKDEPTTGLEPLSLWLFAGCAIVLILGGSYLGAKSVGFDFAKTGRDIEPFQALDAAGGAVELTPLEAYLLAGKNAYGACAGCHMANGAGNGQIPPLKGSEWPAMGTERFAQIVLNGLNGPIKVAGNSYASNMPGQKGLLGDLAIAQVMTYVRHEFNGETDTVITEEMVAGARARFGDHAGQYTVPDLSGADVMLPGDQPDWMSGAAEGDAAGGEEAAADADANAAGETAAPAN